MDKAPLRICIITREFPPDTGWGGIATFSNHLAHGFVELGHTVDVITLAKDEPKTLVTDDITIHRVKPHFTPNDLGLICRALPHSHYIIRAASALWQKFIELHKSKAFDVIDAPELLADAFYPALSKAAPLVIRLYTPHSKFIAERFHNVVPSFDHQFIAMAERAAMLHSDAITSPSCDLAQFVATDLNYPLDQIRILANPIDPIKFCPEGNRALGSKPGLKVLFVGRLEERKGIHYLVEAIPHIVKVIPEAHFYVIGDDTKTAVGHTSVLAELKRALADSNCTRSVTFIDRVPLNELPDYYRSADICIVPSLYDNSPYTCLEAMACGRAVIGTNSGGTPEYLGSDGTSGVLINAKDSAAIAKEVIRLLKDPKERARMGENARNRVLDKFQRREIAAQTTDLYREAIQSFKARSILPLYTAKVEEFLPDMEEITNSFNQMLHEILYHWSYRYRLALFLNRVRTRPRLFFAETVLTIVKGPVKGIKLWNLESKIAALKPVQWLEQQIVAKHVDIEEAKELRTARAGSE